MSEAARCGLAVLIARTYKQRSFKAVDLVEVARPHICDTSDAFSASAMVNFDCKSFSDRDD